MEICFENVEWLQNWYNQDKKYLDVINLEAIIGSQM